MAIDEFYLDNLDEFVNDENKVVTYKWLSRSIGVHVNQAKQMLHTFVQQQRNKKNNDNLYVTYLLAGTQESDDVTPSVVSHKVCVVPEEQLEAVKSQMMQITSCHVYSVQRCQLKDSNCLYATDYDLVKEHILASNQHSAITCKAAVVRTTEELEGLRKRGGEAYAPSYEAKVQSSSGAKGKKHQQGALEAMFGKAQAKKVTTPSTESKATEKAAPKEVQTKPTSKQAKKGGSGIASMFAKQAAKPKPEPTQVMDEEIIDVEMETEIKEEPKETPPVPAVEETKKTKKTKAVKSKKDANRHATDVGQSSKRRRIKQVEASSSSEDEMDVVPPTPPRQPSPAPSPVPSPEPSPQAVRDEEEDNEPKKNEQLGGCDVQSATNNNVRKRNRRRKRVDKTFIDDDGFMVTEKVWESESCTDASDTEEPKAKKTPTAPPKVQPKPRQREPKKEAKKETKKKASPKGTGMKQKSLMSFFTKK